MITFVWKTHECREIATNIPELFDRHAFALRSHSTRILFSEHTRYQSRGIWYDNVIWMEMGILLSFTSLKYSSSMIDRFCLCRRIYGISTCASRNEQDTRWVIKLISDIIKSCCLIVLSASLSFSDRLRGHLYLYLIQSFYSIHFKPSRIYLCRSLGGLEKISLTQVKYFRLYLEMSDSSSKENKRGIWNEITLSQLTKAIASLGDRINKLQSETWRLNKQTRATDSVWNELILSLKLDPTEKTRRSLYNVWNRNRHQIRDLVTMQTTAIANDENSDLGDGDSVSSDVVSVSSRKQLPLQAIISSPIPVRPKRQIHRDNSPNGSRPTAKPMEKWKQTGRTFSPIDSQKAGLSARCDSNRHASKKERGRRTVVSSSATQSARLPFALARST